MRAVRHGEVDRQPRSKPLREDLGVEVLCYDLKN